MAHELRVNISKEDALKGLEACRRCGTYKWPGTLCIKCHPQRVRPSNSDDPNAYGKKDIGEGTRPGRSRTRRFF